MYLRENQPDGSVVAYLELAHNERHPETGSPVAKVIHNFGRAEQVDRDALARPRRPPGAGSGRVERAPLAACPRGGPRRAGRSSWEAVANWTRCAAWQARIARPVARWVLPVLGRPH